MGTAFVNLIYQFIFSPWGLFALAVLDSSLVFFLPLAIDMGVIMASSRHRDVFWAFPLIATAGSLIGAGVTFWVGKKMGERAMEVLVSKRKWNAVQERLNRKGALALIVPALIPPPFPFTPFLLVSGTLEVNVKMFLAVLATARLVRFGVEGLLAYFYGDQLIRIMQSIVFQGFIGILAFIAIAGTAYSGFRIWRSTRG